MISEKRIVLHAQVTAEFQHTVSLVLLSLLTLEFGTRQGNLLLETLTLYDKLFRFVENFFPVFANFLNFVN